MNGKIIKCENFRINNYPWKGMEEIMKVAFFTLGCKVNQYETEVLKQIFFDSGFEICGNSPLADIFVINSCTVTGTGDKKTKQLLRKIRRENENAIICLIGCFPQAFPKEAAKLFEADVITGAKDKSQIIALCKKFLEIKERIIDINPHTKGEKFEKMTSKSFSQKTRAFIKIQDGCDRYCSYCIIPTARGFLRSKPIEDLKQEISELAASGYKEIVLVGINLSKYGVDTGLSLFDAVKVACENESIKRVRLGSLEPDLLDEETIKKLSSFDKLCPHFHLSLQSGCDETLKRMNRHYTSSDYAEIVAMLRKYFDDPSITTDIMVGFPGETDEEFEKSLEFAKQIQFSKAHVFAYSIRPSTVAAKMPNQVPQNIKHERSTKMIETTDLIRTNILNSKIGTTQNVLCEAKHGDNFEGYTSNYTHIVFKSDLDEKELKNKFVTVKITGVNGESCEAEII